MPMIVDGKKIITYSKELLCILLNTTKDNITFFVEEQNTQIQIDGYEYANWLDKRAHLNVVAYKCQDNNNDKDDIEIKNMRERYDDLIKLIENTSKQNICVKFIESSKIFSRLENQTPLEIFLNFEPSNQAVLITYVNKKNITYYKGVKSLNKNFKDLSASDDKKDIIYLTLHLEKMQPNKEGSSKSVTTATFYDGTLEIPYHHMIIADQVSVTKQIEDCMKVHNQGLYAEKDIRYISICPGNMVRCDVLLSICMNNKTLSKYLCVNEKETYHTGYDCKLIAMLGNEQKYTIRVKNKIIDSLTLCKKFGIDYLSPCVSFVTSGIHSSSDADMIGVLIESLMLEYISQETTIKALYDKFLPDIDKYSSLKPVKLTRMKLLRGQSMDLFAQRYSRECPVVPSVIHENFVEKYKAMGRDILRYPKTGPHSRYYMAPKGYYVGLKLNRLKNSDMFPFIVTCYVRNHAEDPNSHTFRYIHDLPMRKYDVGATYINKVKKLKAWHKGIIPQYIANILTGDEILETVRVGLPKHPLEFLSAMINPDKTLVPQLAFQEVPDFTFDEIVKNLLECSSYDSLFNMFRVIEDAINADIVIIYEVNKGPSIKIPNHKDVYLWRKRYDKMLLIANTRINEYETVYEIICRRGSDMFFYPENRLYKEIISMKENMLNVVYRPTSENSLSMHDVEAIEDKITMQYINSRGKTVLIEVDNKLLECYTRPLSCPFRMINIEGSTLKSYINSVKNNITVNKIYHETFLQSSKNIVLHGSHSLDVWKKYETF